MGSCETKQQRKYVCVAARCPWKCDAFYRYFYKKTTVDILYFILWLGTLAGMCWLVGWLGSKYSTDEHDSFYDSHTDIEYESVDYSKARKEMQQLIKNL